MSELEVVRDILGKEKAEELEEARKNKADITDEERKRIRNTNRALEYATEALEDPEQEFEPSTATILWDGGEPEKLHSLFSKQRIVSAMVEDMRDVRQGNYDGNNWSGAELIESFQPHVVSENHPLSRMAAIELDNDYDSELFSKKEEIGEWFKQIRSNFHKIHKEDGLLRDYDPKELREEDGDIREMAEEAYDSRTLEIPEVSDPTSRELLRFLVEDRIHLSQPDENLGSNTKNEYETERTLETEHSRINWEKFSERYGSVPDEEKRELYEAAAKYQDEDSTIDPDLLGRITADVNGRDVEYKAEEKDLAENFGELKRAVAQVEELDFILPVNEKKTKLRTITRTIQNTQEFYETETYKVKRKT